MSQINKEIPKMAVNLLQDHYHFRELTYEITGPRVWSTVLFHNCANSDSVFLGNMVSLVCKKFKVKAIRHNALQIWILTHKRKFWLSFTFGHSYDHSNYIHHDNTIKSNLIT